MVKNLRFKPSTSLRHQKFCMKLLGFWPYRGPCRILYVLYANIVYAIISYLNATTMVMYVVKVWGDMAEMTDSLYMVITVCNNIFKLGLLNKKKMKNVLKMLDSDELNIQTEDQDIIVKKAMKTAYNNGLAFLLISAGVCWSLFLFPLLTGAYAAKRLPLKAWFPYSYSVSPNYEFTYVFQFLGIWVGALANNSIDGLVAGLLSLACGQFYVLKNSLRNLRPRALKQLGKSNEDNDIPQSELIHYFNKDAKLEKEVYQQMKNCIQHHQTIIKYINAVQDAFNESMFSQFVTSTLVICITAFDLSTVKPFSGIFFTMSLYLLHMIMQLFFYCWFGNEIYLLSQTVTDDVYHSDWIRFEPGTKRLMFIMMERSKTPISVTAGKLFYLSIENFTSILKSAYSFYAVLNQMQLDLDATDSSSELNT